MEVTQNNKVRHIQDKVILLTGGTGSFGRGFVKEALTFSPRIIRVFSNDEASQVEMRDEFRQYKNIRYLLGDVRDKERLNRAMNGVEIVIHAAAIKHVPVCEYDPGEAIKTNVLGSINVAECAMDNGVPKVVFISSDKAVHPISLYGATKLCAEKYFISLYGYSPLKFSCIRFGNFWGSRGSVIDKWMKQRIKNEPIEVTDKDMTRYFITIEEAARFTIGIIDRMRGGEIFVPIMPTHSLAELASNIAPDSRITIIGKRKGEKKHEELLSEEDIKYAQKLDDCWVIRYS